MVNHMDEETKICELLKKIPDPEIPVLSVIDLGIVKEVQIIAPQEEINITITPTYSGCPAMDLISMQIRSALISAGYKKINLQTALSPAWTTEWISEEGRRKLKAYGIAPPHKQQHLTLFAEREAVQCPQCNSVNTSLISEFGSTACKALYRCNNCNEPFDHFKCH